MIRRISFPAGCVILVAFFSARSPKAQPTESPATVAARTMQGILTQISDQISQSETLAPSPTATDTPAPAITDTPTIIATVPLSAPTDTLPAGITPLQPTPTGPTPTTDPNSLLTRTLVGKCVAAFYVGDIGPIQDNSEVKAGAKFTKTWDIRNIGLCTWNRSYQLFFFGTGTQHMFGPDSVNFPEIVPPNKNTWLSVNLVAPDSLGVHTGTWYLKDDQGNRFGVGPNGDEPLIVRIRVVA
jgi:hypothetical protein